MDKIKRFVDIGGALLDRSTREEEKLDSDIILLSVLLQARSLPMYPWDV
jgi:hypothetical protein